MAQYIEKSVVMAEIDNMLNTKEHTSHIDEIAFNSGRWKALKKVKDIIDTLEVKDMDLEKVYKAFVVEYPVYNRLINGIVCKAIAKHFFELGISINHPITASDKGIAEEIILNLEKIEKDYNLCLIKEKEWINKQIQKGE